jgi:flagellar protein FliS
MYATPNLQDRYKQDYITTASPIDLIIMLYDGCIKQLKLAKIFLETDEKEEPEAPRNFLMSIEKAEEIILELIRSLNMKIEMANDLMDLYQFMVNELVEVTFSRERERLDPVIEMLESLRESWVAVKAGQGSSYSAEEGMQG